MDYAKNLKAAASRAAVAGLLAWGLFGTAVVSAAPANTVSPEQATGMLVGSVTCGPNGLSPNAPATIAVQGLNLTTQSDGSGNFVLPVPAAQTITVQALADSGTSVATRPDVSVAAGQTLDIGSLDLAVCPQPAMPVSSSDQTQNLGDYPGGN
jgi:hypothetical protein